MGPFSTKNSLRPKNNIFVMCICALHILLFVYAALVKVLDFENFKAQLGQSPLLTSWGDLAAVMVPTTELGIAALLIIPRTQLMALYMSYFMMSMFSVYIGAMFIVSPYLPCSCGGILETLSWSEHLVFNIIFLLLSAYAIITVSNKIKSLSDGNP